MKNPGAARFLTLGLACVACWLLVACALPQLESLAPSVEPAAVDPSPTATLPPTATPAPQPSLPPTPTPGASPSPTASATPVPTAVPTLTPVPGPTLPPEAAADRLDAARRLQANGDYEQAIAAYRAVLDGRPRADLARRAAYGLGECLLLDGEHATAAAAWEQFIVAYPQDSALPYAHLMAARAYRALGDCAGAVPHLQAYLAFETVLGDWAYEAIGDCHAGGGEWEAAVGAYRQGLALALDRSTQVGLREEIAGAHLSLGQPELALEEYDAILAVARQEAYRAKIEYLAGQALAGAGQTEAAHIRYRRAVERYPRAEYAYLSLVELVDAGVAVDEFQRGLVDYYAGASYPDAYGAAVRAFDRYLEIKPAPHADEALYRKAQAQAALEQTADALDTLERLILDHPRSPWLASAWYEKAAILASTGEVEGAVRAYRDVAAFFPADKLAPDALLKAAKLREGKRQLAEAAQLYEELQAGFPGFEEADAALWQAGLLHYRAGDRRAAVAAWRSLLDKYRTSIYRLNCLYWLGKLGEKPARPAEKPYWDQLGAYPYDYYALRVQQIRRGESLTADRLNPAPAEPSPWDEQAAGDEILAWLRGWTPVPTATTLIELPAALTSRPDFRRGQALLSVGLRREALAALDGARAASWNDPVALAQWAFAFRREGAIGLAARCAARVAGLWPKGLIYQAPPSLQHLAFPLAYADLLSAEAAEWDLDPLLLAALIRQESLFEPVAESYAGARGLGQVMPATGEGIAKSLGLEGFALDDLYRPHISVRFAAFYLAAQMRHFDGQLLVALAAYNGGPGNTLRWLEAGGDDLDLFVEVITAPQSRHYLKKVYEQYLAYETLYR